MPRRKSAKQDTSALLTKALTAKTLSTRLKAWTAAQRRLKVKKGAALNKFVEGVKKGDKKHAVGLIAAIIGEKKRNFDPELDVTRDIKLVPKPKGKRKRNDETSSSKKVAKITPATADDFKVISNGKTIAGINPQVMQYVLNGDVEGMSAKLSMLEVKDLFTSRLQNAPLQSNQYVLVKDFLLNSTKLMKRILAVSVSNEEMQQEIDAINKYRQSYEKGLRPDTQQINDSLGHLLRLVNEKQAVISSQENVDLSGILTQFEKDSALAIQNERLLREDYEAQKEAELIFTTQSRLAAEEAVKASEEFTSLTKQRDVSSTVSSFIADEKTRADTEPLLNKAAERYATEKNKQAVNERLAEMTKVSRKRTREMLESGQYGRLQREFEEAVIEEVSRSIKKRLTETQQSQRKTNEKITQLSKDLPAINEMATKVLKDRADTLPDLEKENRELSSLQSQLRSLQEEQVSVENTLLNAKEDKAALSKVIVKTAKKRVLGAEDAETSIFRSKIRKTDELISTSEDSLKNIKGEINEKEAKITSLQMNREYYKKEEANTKSLCENSVALDDLFKQNLESVDLLNQSSLVEVETIALGGQMVKNNNEVGNKTIDLQFLPDASRIRLVETPLKLSPYQKALNEITEKLKTNMDQFKQVVVALEASNKSLSERGLSPRDIAKELKPIQQMRTDLVKQRLELANEYKELVKKYAENTGVDPNLAVDLYDWKKADLTLPDESQSRVIVPTVSTSNVTPSVERINIELDQAISPTAGKKRGRGYDLSGGSGALKLPKRPKAGSGPFLVGGRPDPLLNLQFWKDLYNKTKK